MDVAEGSTLGMRRCSPGRAQKIGCEFWEHVDVETALVEVARSGWSDANGGRPAKTREGIRTVSLIFSHG